LNQNIPVSNAEAVLEERKNAGELTFTNLGRVSDLTQKLLFSLQQL
jgi:hypothetical protein